MGTITFMKTSKEKAQIMVIREKRLKGLTLNWNVKVLSK